jgi:hypothetical protein
VSWFADKEVFVETVIGVFSSREAKALRELLDGKIPQDSIVFLTRSETDAKLVEKDFMGMEAAMSAGVVVAITMLAVPGIG